MPCPSNVGRYCKSSPLQVGQRNPEAKDFWRVLLFPDGKIASMVGQTMERNGISLHIMPLQLHHCHLEQNGCFFGRFFAGCQVKLVHFLEITFFNGPAGGFSHWFGACWNSQLKPQKSWKISCCRQLTHYFLWKSLSLKAAKKVISISWWNFQTVKFTHGEGIKLDCKCCW